MQLYHQESEGILAGLYSILAGIEPAVLVHRARIYIDSCLAVYELGLGSAVRVRV